MNDLIVKEFRDKEFYSLVWNDKPCWVAVDVASLFGYIHKSKPIMNCIRREKFELGIEYDVLDGDELKNFKEVFSEQLGDTKYAPKVIILYEVGLYGFLTYTEMPLGVEFRNWIRRDVMPTLREKGYYVMDGAELPNENIQKPEAVHNLSDFGKFSTEKMERYRLAFETAKILQPSLDKITKDPVYKFLVLKQIFVDAGINIPQFIGEELM
ncbi:BRO family protein [uncultured Clostridium sp.]|jgi:prophage antirepressor-like protein|uniref:BRO family protein n=1 Tax=uncultured Clostridium sp. TaxID=59620 RepID=UPI0026139936|nr:BRO family protein [uncultured Clostridium sp.]